MTTDRYPRSDADRFRTLRRELRDAPGTRTVDAHRHDRCHVLPGGTVAGDSGSGVFEVVFRRGVDEESEQVARNVSPFTVEPGKFTYRLVKGELDFTDYGQIFAHCRVDKNPWHIVPFTLLPPADD